MDAIKGHILATAILKSFCDRINFFVYRESQMPVVWGFSIFKTRYNVNACSIASDDTRQSRVRVSSLSMLPVF
jgi:hypothetical protein